MEPGEGEVSLRPTIMILSTLVQTALFILDLNMAKSFIILKRQKMLCRYTFAQS